MRIKKYVVPLDLKKSQFVHAIISTIMILKEPIPHRLPSRERSFDDNVVVA